MSSSISFTHLLKIIVRFDPLNSKSAKICRTILSGIPPKMKNTLELKAECLPPSSNKKETVSFMFKDKKELFYDPNDATLEIMSHEVHRYTKKLQLKETIEKFA